ncbi:TetR/AcrR family transcriptional regulator [Martelella endophytica]|uniref:TetR family transcriptional regulator n=1 Tax=Martelella endophytica TaxID=1486262 RepID=A0A0D5LNR1_MAREN|nr:TetR/AcrR family transcriptional regulator [Martelella endophytica]AJY45397.1 TetR family transcriptional regulator [Martelella endophytica]
MSQATKEKKRRASIGASRNPESQEAILQAAEAILLEAGLHGFSIEAVARRAHAGKPTIYRWWPNKTALLLDVYLRQKSDNIFADTGDVEEDVFLFLKRLIGYWRETPGGALFRSVIAAIQGDPDMASTLRAFAHERHQRTAEIFRRGQERGEIAAWVDPKLSAEITSYYAWGRLLRDELDVADEILRQVARQIVEGLRSR